MLPRAVEGYHDGDWGNKTKNSTIENVLVLNWWAYLPMSKITVEMPASLIGIAAREHFTPLGRPL